MKLLNLFIDESGHANPKQHRSPYYILCGCLIADHVRQLLKTKADQIKFKYWGREDVIFHSREIYRKENEFEILKDPDINSEFEKDLFSFLCRGGYQIFIVLVDNEKASKKNWNEIKVYKESSDIMVKNFILALIAKKQHGHLIIESATAQKDFMFHKAVGHYLSNGIKKLSVGFDVVQKYMTEISFVTKKNHDIEEQIADLLAYGAKLKMSKKSQKKLKSYDKNILKVLESKLFSSAMNLRDHKKKFYSEINSFKIIP